MGAQVGSAFIRVRPNMAGFKAETETGVKSAFAGVGKITATLFAIGGTYEALKKIAGAASEDQAAFAVLDHTLTNAHAATTLFGKSIEELIKQQARQRGFQDEDLASSFVRLVSATHDSAKAFRDLGLAEDVSRARHIGVAQAALAVSKAEQGVNTALQRLGIIVRPVTANVDALKQAHDGATAAGVKFTKQQDAAYKSALANAAAQDKILSRNNAIATLQQRFGGSAATFANTASGAWERLHEQVHLFENFLGSQVLPGLTNAGLKVGDFFQKLTENQGFKSGISQTLDLIKTTAEAVGPPLLAVGKALSTVTSTLGVPTLIAAAVAYKAIAASTTLAESASKKWAAASKVAGAAQAAGTAETETEVSAEAAFSKALETNTAALVRNTAAATANADAQELRLAILSKSFSTIPAATAETEALTVAQVENTAAALPQAGALATLRVGLLGLVGGPLGALTLGLAAAAGGIVYLLTRQTAWDRANQQTTNTLNTLATAMQRTRDLRQQIGDQRTTIATDKTSVAQARLGVAQAQAALSTTSAAKGSLEYEQAALAVTSAIQQYQAAVKSLSDDQRHLGALSEQARNSAEKQSAALAAGLPIVNQTVQAVRDRIIQQELLGIQAGESAAAAKKDADQSKFTAKAISDLVGSLNKQATALQAQSPLLAHNTALLAQFTQAIGNVPTRHETQIILSNKNAKAALDDLVGNLIPTAFNEADAFAKESGAGAGASWITGFGQALKGGQGLTTPFLDSLLTGLGDKKKPKDTAAALAASIKTDAAAAKVAQEAASNASKALSAAQSHLSDVSSSAKDAIQSAADGVQSAQDNLAQVIANGPKQITDAVNSAKQSLFSIGQSLASSIDAFLQGKGSLGGPLSGPAAKEFARLSDLIKKGGATPEIQARAAALSADLQAQSAKAAIAKTTKLTTGQQIADLVDVFTKGPETAAAQKRFNAGIAKILKIDKVTRAAVTKELGVAAADELFAQVPGLAQQARALGQGPRRPGTGREPSIVRPEQTVIQVQKDIANAQKAVSTAQLAEAKAQTAQLKDIRKATQAVATALKTVQFTKTQAGKKAATLRKATTQTSGNHGGTTP